MMVEPDRQVPGIDGEHLEAADLERRLPVDVVHIGDT